MLTDSFCFLKIELGGRWRIVNRGGRDLGNRSQRSKVGAQGRSILEYWSPKSDFSSGNENVMIPHQFPLGRLNGKNNNCLYSTRVRSVPQRGRVSISKRR